MTYDWVENLLTSFHAQAKLLGFVTATTHEDLRHDFESLRIDPTLLDYIQVVDDTLYYKLDLRVFEPALSFLKTRGIGPLEVLYVGDGLNDMEATVNAGIPFLGVGVDLVTLGLFRNHGAACILSLSGVGSRL